MLKFPKPVRQPKKRKRISPVRDWRKKLGVDTELTRTMSFFDRRSHMMNDGRLLAYGKDMTLQRTIIQSGSRSTCKLCGKYAHDGEVDHVESKGKHLRNDHLSNLRWLCKPCHRQRHNREPKWRQHDTD